MPILSQDIHMHFISFHSISFHFLFYTLKQRQKLSEHLKVTQTFQNKTGHLEF